MVISIGDKIRCINADGLKTYNIVEGKEYFANSVVEIPGDKTYVTIPVEGSDGKIAQFFVVDAARFEVVEEDDASAD